MNRDDADRRVTAPSLPGNAAETAVDTVHPGPGADRHSRVIAVVATTMVLALATMTALFPAAMAPALARALDVSAALVGFQIALVYAGAMITSLVGGALTHRSGPCRASQIALSLLCLGAMLAALPSAGTFALASLVVGLGYGLTNPAASYLLVRLTPPRRRGLVFSIKQTGAPLGGVLAGACAPVLVVLAGWQVAMLAVASASAVAALLLQWRRRAWDHEREPGRALFRSPLSDLALVWSVPTLRYLSLAGLCLASVQLCVSAFTVTLLVEDLAVDLVRAGLVMSAVLAAGVAGRLLWGWIADRGGSTSATLALAASLAALAALVTSRMTPDWPFPLVVLMLCLMGFSALGWNGVYLARVAHLAPDNRVAAASGGSLVFIFGGALVGPLSFAGLHGLLGSYTLGFAVLAAVAMTGLLMVLRGAALASVTDANPDR